MRITALVDASSDHNHFRAECEFGLIQGTWRGSDPVSSGQMLDVELEFAEPVTWDDLAAKPSESESRGNFVVGTISSVFDDGVVGVQLGSAVLLLEVSGSVPSDRPELIRLSPDNFEFWPTEI